MPNPNTATAAIEYRRINLNTIAPPCCIGFWAEPFTQGHVVTAVTESDMTKLFDHRFAAVYRLSVFTDRGLIVSPPTRGKGRPESVTEIATRISFARGASARRTSIPSKWLRT